MLISDRTERNSNYMFVIQEKPLFLRFQKIFNENFSQLDQRNIDFDLTAEETSEMLTDIGLRSRKIRAIRKHQRGLNGIVVGRN